MATPAGPFPSPLGADPAGSLHRLLSRVTDAVQPGPLTTIASFGWLGPLVFADWLKDTGRLDVFGVGAGQFVEHIIRQDGVWRQRLERVKELAQQHHDHTPVRYDAIFAVLDPTAGNEEDFGPLYQLLTQARPDAFVVLARLGERPLTAWRHVREFCDQQLHSTTRILLSESGESGPDLLVGRWRPPAERVFTSYDIQNCLYDEERVGYFQKAISEKVRTGDVVVDAGSGSGVLGLLAAQAGAARVYCVELNYEYSEVIRENARNNGVEDRIVVIHGDASQIAIPEPVDVVLSEVISGGLFYEAQMQIMCNLRRFLRPGGVVVPARMTNAVELVHAQDELYGLRFTYDTRHRALRDHALSTAATYLEVEFAEDQRLGVSSTVQVTATGTGTVNAVRIPYELQFSPGVVGKRATEFLLNPQIIFLKDPVGVVEGQRYDVSLRYSFGESPLKADISVRPAAAEVSG